MADGTKPPYPMSKEQRRQWLDNLTPEERARLRAEHERTREPWEPKRRQYQMKVTSGIRHASDNVGWLVALMQKPKVCVVCHLIAFQLLPEFVGLSKQPCPFDVVPPKENQDLVRIGGVAEDPANEAAVSAASWFLLVEVRLPFRIVGHLVADKERWH